MDKTDYLANEVSTLEECDVCGGHQGISQCLHLKIIKNVKDELFVSKARLTLPQNLELKEKEGQIIVITKTNIPSGTQFGPLEAPVYDKFVNGLEFPLMVFSKDGNFDILDTTDENKCNWMCLLSDKDEKKKNLVVYQLNKSIYFSTIRELLAGEELKVGYSIPYGKKVASTGIRKKLQNCNYSSISCNKTIDINTTNSSTRRKQKRPYKISSNMEKNYHQSLINYNKNIESNESNSSARRKQKRPCKKSQI